MKSAVITGASIGIGRVTAIEMAKAGYHVFLVARTREKLEETAKIISDAGGTSTIFSTDLSDLNQVNILIKLILNQAKSIDAIINIAGVWHGQNEVYADKDFQSFDQQIILDTYTVGFTAPTLIVHGLLPLMHEKAKVINLSGTFENGAKGWLPYFASKRAIEDFTVGLAQELKGKNIQVNCISPSDTATESYLKHFPQYIEDAIDPKKIAHKIIELCDEENTTTGKVIVMKKGKDPFEGFHS